MTAAYLGRREAGSHGLISSPTNDNVPNNSKFQDEVENDDLQDVWASEDDSDHGVLEGADAPKNSPRLIEIPVKKTRSERIKDHQAERALQKIKDSERLNSEEDERERRLKSKALEEESDLKLAADLFGFSSGPDNSTCVETEPVVLDLSSALILNPLSRNDFQNLRDTLIPIIGRNLHNPHYFSFLQEFMNSLAQDLPADEMRKIGSNIVRLSNDKKAKEEAAQKHGKSSNTGRSKTSEGGK